MAKQEITIVFRAKNFVSKQIKRILSSVKRLGMGIKRFAFSVKGMAAAGGALFLFTKAIKKSFDFELYQGQFQILLGSLDKAKKRFSELKELSAGTPFELEGLVKASKILEAMGFKGSDNLKMLREVGDAAASMDPTKLQEIAFWMGRLNVGAQAGQTGEATNRLLELALITGETKMQIDAMAKAGKGQAAIMAMARKEIGKFAGGMEKLSTTGSGLFSTLKDNWTLALVAFGDEFKELAKSTIGNLIDRLKSLREDGSISRWAGKAAEGLRIVKGLMDDILGGGQKRTEALATIGEGIKLSFILGAASAVDVLLHHAPKIGEGIWKGLKAAEEKGFKKISGIDAANKRMGFFQGEKPIDFKESKKASEAMQAFIKRLAKANAPALDKFGRVIIPGVNMNGEPHDLFKKPASTTAKEAAGLKRVGDRMSTEDVFNRALGISTSKTPPLGTQEDPIYTKELNEMGGMA